MPCSRMLLFNFWNHGLDRSDRTFNAIRFLQNKKIHGWDILGGKFVDPIVLRVRWTDLDQMVIIEPPKALYKFVLKICDVTPFWNQTT